MKKSLILLGMSLLAACGVQKTELPLLPEEAFQTTVDGKPVALYTLRAGDITMQVTNYGARVVSLWTPDREGRYEDIVLGYENIGRYIDNTGERFLGAVVGPYANRIAKGRFTLDGTEYTLPLNNNGQTLHGGLKGVDRVVWDVVSATDDKLVLHYLHPDGQDGFPGNLDIEMTYSLTPDNEFRVDYKATTDKPTVANFSHHPFFNLKGEGNGTVLDNVLTINASHTTPVDSVLIPTGQIAPVEGTPFDFREPHAIGERIGADDQQLRNGGGYDHNWVIGTGYSVPHKVLTATGDQSGISMDLSTDYPGIQLYTANYLEHVAGKQGHIYEARDAVCFEPQYFPDAIHHPNFPSPVVKAGETYKKQIIYHFYTD